MQHLRIIPQLSGLSGISSRVLIIEIGGSSIDCLSYLTIKWRLPIADTVGPQRVLGLKPCRRGRLLLQLLGIGFWLRPECCYKTGG